MTIIYGILGIAAGILYIRYSDVISRTLGPVPWAERNLGSGGSYTLHKIIGVIIVVVSILAMTGTTQYIISNTLGRFFSSGQYSAEQP